MEEIVKRIQKGEKYLLNDFIKDNMKYIYNITKKFYGIFEDYDDLVQEALITFIKAVYSFDTTKKYFLPYLNIKILSTVNKYVNSNLDRIIDNKKRKEIALGLYKKCQDRVEFEPDVDALMRYYGLYVSDAQKLYNICKNDDIYCNIDDFNNYYQDYSLDDLEHEIDSNLLFKNLNLKLLTENEKEYIRLKYIENIKNDSEIARCLGVSKQLICNRSKHLERKLKLILKKNN